MLNRYYISTILSFACVCELFKIALDILEHVDALLQLVAVL